MMTRLERFQKELMARADAALITSPQNQFYLSGLHYDDGYLLILADAAYLLADFRYIEVARREADPAFTVVLVEKGMNKTVAELIGKHKAESLLVEEAHMTLAAEARLSAAVPQISVVRGATEILTEMRVLKDPRELSAIAAAQELTDAAFSHILEYIRPDLREIDVALELEFFMRKNGAEGLAFDTIAVSGSASSMPHGVPRDRRLEKGFLTMDFGARLGGYCSDMTRTVVIGKADDEMKRLYETVLTAQKSALAAARGGVGCKALDAVARDIIHGAGYVGCFGHSLGHGVGIDIHEAPRLSSAAPQEDLLRPGHVVTVEPGIYLEGKYGCRIEDMIAVLPDGSIRNFTQSPKELIEL